MDRKTKGRLAEVKVFAYLIENGYEVYLPFSNNSKYDAISVKDGIVKRISIKYTSAKKEIRDMGSRNETNFSRKWHNQY